MSTSQTTSRTATSQELPTLYPCEACERWIAVGGWFREARCSCGTVLTTTSLGKREARNLARKVG